MSEKAASMGMPHLHAVMTRTLTHGHRYGLLDVGHTVEHGYASSVDMELRNFQGAYFLMRRLLAVDFIQAVLDVQSTG